MEALSLRAGYRLPRVEVFREYGGVRNADLSWEGSRRCSLACKNQFESYTSALPNSPEVVPDAARCLNAAP